MDAVSLDNVFCILTRKASWLSLCLSIQHSTCVLRRRNSWEWRV
jgi:hypothetical protein